MISCIVNYFQRPGNGRCCWRHTAVVARIRRKIYSNRCRGSEKIQFKAKKQSEMGRLIFVHFGLYFCQQIVACPSSKMLVKALRIGRFKYIFEYISILW